MANILVPLAQGFEETEAVTIIDILRRAGLHVILAGVETKTVTGSHGITLEGDLLLEKVDRKMLDGVVLPGGQPGSKNLMKSALLRDILIELDRQQHLVAAICAAPMVLEAAGILKGKRVTAYPGYEKEFKGGIFSTDAVVEDGHVVTSRGVGTALAFALALVGKLCGAEKQEELKKAVIA
jgi:4-methyl-5(b-hydroxyethyl)-thiazole monophosphate biosynthesis